MEIKEKIKKELLEYFERTLNSIDINGQSYLFKLDGDIASKEKKLNNLTETNDKLVELIYSLDMVTYISSPNYFNSYDEHIGLIKYLNLNEN